MAKKFLKRPWVQATISWLVARYIAFVCKTCRWQLVGKGPVDDHLAAGKAFIACFWHGRMGLMVHAWHQRSVPFHMLISAHGDGRLISGAMAHFGIHTITGSSRKGGALALMNVVDTLGKGEVVGFTPDGPRGPRHTVAPGIVHAARLAQVDIIPASFATSRHKKLKSWDHFYIPFPFSRAVLVMGEPIVPPDSADETEIARVTKLVENGLNDAMERADALCLRPID